MPSERQVELEFKCENFHVEHEFEKDVVPQNFAGQYL